MTIELFDAQAGFGGAVKGETAVVSAEQYVAEMARLDVAAALVRTWPDDLSRDAVAANEELLAACRARPSLLPCPALVPNGAYNLPEEKRQVDTAIGERAAAGCLRPKADQWLTDEWCCGRLLTAMQERRLPAYCSANHFDLSQVAEIAGRYPKLPILLAEVHYLQQRTLLPLLETFANVHLCLGTNYVVFGGLEMLVAKTGPERLLFGTGFPRTEPMTAVTQLTYARISDDAKRLIGAGNLKRLIGGIQS